MQAEAAEYIVFISFLLLSLAAVLLFILSSAKDRRTGLMLAATFGLSFLAAMAWYILQAPAYFTPLLIGLLSLTLFFTLMTFCYSSHGPGFYAFLADALLLMLCLSTAFGVQQAMNFMAAMAIGGAFGAVSNGKVFHFNGNKTKFKPSAHRRHLEIKRDIFQIAIGAAVILVILTYGVYARTIVFAAILLGLAYSNVVGRIHGVPFAGFLHSMERSRTTFGLGALYLAVGVAMILGMVASTDLILLSLIALFFGDSAATIGGTLFGSIKLPYNRSKSLQGLIGYFVVVAALGYFVVGVYSLIIGLMFAVVESMDLHIDDNLAIALFTVVISFV